MSNKSITFYMIGFVVGPVSYRKYKTASKKRHEKIVNNIAMYTK